MNLFVIVIFFCYVLTRERFFAPVSVFQREFPLFEIPFLLVAVVFGLRHYGLLLEALKRRVTIAWLPFLGLGIILPVLGIIFSDYPITSIYAIVVVVIAPCCAAIVGILAYSNDLAKKYFVIHWCLNTCLLIQAGLALVQLLRVFGYSNFIVDFVTVWDISSQMRLKEEYVIIGRSVGTYINPNVLGVFSVLAFFWNLVCGRGVSRVFFCLLAGVTLLCTQSRGSAFALLVGLFAYLLVYIRNHQIVAKGGTNAFLLITCALLAGGILITSLVPSWSFLPGSDRWKEGAAVVTHGAEADANFLSRWQVWKEAIVFLNEYPFGTWGPPQVLFVLPPDNLYVYTLLQGSLIYLASLVGAFLLTASLMLRINKLCILVGLLSLSMAANSVSALPVLYSPGLLFWFFLGCLVSESMRESNAEREKLPVHEDVGDLQGGRFST